MPVVAPYLGHMNNTTTTEDTMTTAITAEGHTVDLTDVTASGHFMYATTTVTYWHAKVAVFTPAEGGGAYCWNAVCNHDHPDTKDGYLATQGCQQRLARIISQGRIPKWATLHSGS